MVRANKPANQPTAKSEQSRLLFLQSGTRYEGTLPDLDFDTAMFAQALLLLMNEGATVVCRPGSGCRSFGVAVWQGDAKYAPKWLYDDEEVNQWSSRVVEELTDKKTGD